MNTLGSLDRAIHVTGMRGVGKTTLLETLSERAASKGRRVFDLGPDDTINLLLSNLVDYTDAAATVSPKMTYGRRHLQSMFIKACERAKYGVLVAIDDTQSIGLDDVSAIVNAVQMASRKGYDIMLAVASLPSGYDKVNHHDGCTFFTPCNP